MHSRDVFPGCFLYKTAASMQNRPVFAAPPERLRIRKKPPGPLLRTRRFFACFLSRTDPRRRSRRTPS